MQDSNYSEIENCSMKFAVHANGMSEYVYNSNPRVFERSQGEYLTSEKPIESVFGSSFET
jgi:hypothetical protein